MEEEKLDRTLEITTSILNTRDLDALLQKVVDAVTDDYGFEACDAFLLDEERDNFVLKASKGYPGPMADRIPGLAVSKRHIKEGLQECEKLGKHTYLYKAGANSKANDYYGILHPERLGKKRASPDDWSELDVLYVLFEDPDGRIVGLLEPDGPRSGKLPSPTLVKSLEMFAGLASAAIVNAKLVGALNRTVKLFRALLDTTAAMQAPVELADTIKIIADKLNELVPFDEVSVYLVDWNKNLLKPIYATGPFSEEVMTDIGPITGLAGEVARTGKVDIVGDSVDDPRVEDIPGIEEIEIHQTIMAIPLKGKMGVEGVLELYRDKSRKFTDVEWAVAEPFAGHAAIALENAKLRADLMQNLETAQKAYEEMKDLDQMKDGLVDTISHELRTPLTTIMGYLEMISSGMYGEVTPQMNQKLEKMLEQVKRINLLVATMLEMSRLEKKTLTLDFENVNLAMVTQEVLIEQEAEIKERNHTVTTLFGTDLPIVQADRMRIHDVISNMVSNAVKYTNPGGVITIGADILGGKVHMWVKDSGIGIAPADQPKLFDRFFLAEAGLTRGDGRVGIGLYTSREIVRRHFGEMWFESKKGLGSTFHFTIPFRQPLRGT